MKSNCDHDGCKTTFCPHCGAAVNAGPRDQIIAYTGVYVRKYENELKEAEERAAKSGDTYQDYYKGRIPKLKANLERWKSWLVWAEGTVKEVR